MTEAFEDGLERLVRVRAQVMCRDEGTGGWVALGGGGLSTVTVGRRPLVDTESKPDDEIEVLTESPPPSPQSDVSLKRPAYDYFIYGKRISDQTVVLQCTMKKDFKYNKVMPTFHHWVNEQKRYGLTFQTAADARAFDKGVRAAVADILDGLVAKKNADPRKDEDDENNIFECLDLPSDSRPGSEKSVTPRRTPSLQTPILSAINLPHRKNEDKSGELISREKQMQDKPGSMEEPIDAENYSYVQLTAVHEYAYPSLEGIVPPVCKAPLADPESGGSIKKAYPHGEMKPVELTQFHSRLKCRHCQEWYLESGNRAGVCEFAPDKTRSCVRAVSCVCAAQCMVYHCMSDSEGENVSDPCACTPVDSSCTTRWVGVCLLSLLVPCLWLYPILGCIHKCCRKAHIAGGRHQPQTPWSAANPSTRAVANMPEALQCLGSLNIALNVLLY